MSEIKINTQGEVKLYDSDNSNYIGLKAPATVGSNETFILPDADGSANNALKTDGSGNLGFVDVTTLVTSGIDWQSSIQTTGFTAVSGKGYFCNTTGGAFTATLPASPSAGDIVGLKDYAATFGSNALTVGRNSSNIQGAANDSKLSTDRASVVLVYVDSTKGWLYVQESNVSNLGPTYISATGGTITTSGDYKIHTFTSTGTFTVSSVGNSAGGADGISYVVVGGGGSGGTGGGGVGGGGGGGGAGGFREGKNSGDPYSASPLNAPAGLTVSASPGSYPVTIGAGAGTNSGAGSTGSAGSVSTFSTITSAGGGGGGSSSGAGTSGASGGGNGYNGPGSGGAGNTPPVSPPQGSAGGAYSTGNGGGGGGGATAAGAVPAGVVTGGDGGAGATSSINGTPTARAGGGGGSSNTNGGAGGAGGGGAGSESPSPVGQAGTANTGGGGGGDYGTAGSQEGGAGGSGTVIIRYKYQN